MWHDMPQLVDANGGPPEGIYVNGNGPYVSANEEDYQPTHRRPGTPHPNAMHLQNTGHKPTSMWGAPPAHDPWANGGVTLEFPPSPTFGGGGGIGAVPPPPGSHPNTPAMSWGQPTPASSFMQTPGWAQPPPHGYIPPPPGATGVGFGPPPGPPPGTPWGPPMHGPPPPHQMWGGGGMQMHMNPSPYVTDGAFDDLQPVMPNFGDSAGGGGGGMHPLPHMNFAPPYPPHPMGGMGPPPPHAHMAQMPPPGMMASAPGTPMDYRPPMAGPGISRSISYGGHPSSPWGPAPGGMMMVKSRGGGGGKRRPRPLSEPEYDEDHPAARPRDWRPDFTTKTGLGAVLSKLGNGSVPRGWVDDVKRKAAFHLEWSPLGPPLYYDMRQDYETNPESLHFFINGRRTTNELDLLQLACSPATHLMRLWHKRLPWYITIEASRENGITVSDLLSQLHDQLSIGITGKHYWNKEIGQSERERLSRAFGSRCRLVGGFEREALRGVKRVDFLGDECILQGIVRGKNGMWEMKTSSELMLKD